MRGGLLIAAAACAAGCSVEVKVPLGDAGVGAPGDGRPQDVPAHDPPETTIVSAPDAISRAGASTFRFGSDDAAATFVCRLDGGAPVACQSPYARTLGDGPHTFAVRAIDRAGNADRTPAEHVWWIDTAAPDTVLQSAPAADDNSSIVRFEFRASEPSCAFECSLDGTGYAACASGDLFGPIGDGVHALAVRARDRAGNLDPSPAIHTWLVDASAPDTAFVSAPSGATASTTAAFAFVSPNAGPFATFECALDGAPYAACVAPLVLAGLGAGAHAFAVRVRDELDDVDPTPAIRAWTVDLTPPDTAILSGPSGPWPAASAIFTFSSNEAGATFECALDGAPFAACASPFMAAALAQGGHAFAVRAIDGAGHVDPTPAARAWTVDTSRPW